MKTIAFIRHAKSDWNNDLPDFERPLKKRGKNDAPMMGKYIRDSFTLPDLIISSPATRARQTAELLAAELGYPADSIAYARELYMADSETYFRIIHEIEDNVDNVYIVSHNPGTENIINQISDARLDHMPTCGIAQIGFEVNAWLDVHEASGKILRFDIPKNHK